MPRSFIPGQQSLDDLGTPLRDVTFCVLDLETTGTNRTGDMITEIGVVKVRGGECLGTFHTLINPGRAIPPQITVITGLTDAIVRNAPRIETVLGSLRDFLGDAVFVAHNASFDLGFIRAAFERDGRSDYRPTVVDTAVLARRLLRDEVPNFKLGTLATRLRLAHLPSHRALDDALATTDLLHLLLERASGWGVLGLDDLVAVGKLAGHPQASKLDLTTDLPRSPGVYLFLDHRAEVLYVGKATNLRQRVRSYFGSDDRRRVGPMLREMRAIDHLPFADPLTAEVVESRLIARLLPRYNRAGTRVDRYCSVRLDTQSPWPRLSIVRHPTDSGEHLGPLPSRAVAAQVIDALQSALPLRRCSTRLGASYRVPDGATACGAAQLGVAQCPCAGMADRASYERAVEVAVRTMRGDPDTVTSVLVERMAGLAAAQRFEEAAMVRDRTQALLTVVRRRRLTDAVRALGRCVVECDGATWVIDAGRLVGPDDTLPVDDSTDAVLTSRHGARLPIGPPTSTPLPGPLGRDAIDEALLLAKFLDRHATRVTVRECTGEWTFPVVVPELAERVGRPDRFAA